MNPYIALLLSLLTGAIGWIFSQIFIKPLLRIQELRGEINAELIFTGNVSPTTASPEEVRAAQVSLRRLASDLLGAWNTAFWPAGWILEGLGIAPGMAGAELMGLSNEIAGETKFRNLRRDAIEFALNLPRSSETAYVAELKRQAYDDERGQHPGSQDATR